MQVLRLRPGLLSGRPTPAGSTRASSEPATDVHYRADVDGLRAIAVIPVVLFHAGFRAMSGGFVGVDVFFVISGFLITGILAREISEGRYSILEFYRRRARRIFPALTAVTIATLLAGFFVLTPVELVDLAKSAAAVSIFSSNIYFWKSVSYFQSANEFRPLLHTWSLAVEEQYYVFFPLLLRLLHLRRSGIVAALWLICVTSLALAAFMVPWKPSAAFYLLPTRAWELMLGGLLAVGGFPRPASRLLSSVASMIGLALIAIPMFVYTAATPFPGLAAVPPTVGTALVIWARGCGFVARFLSLSPVVSVGKASYSIYLWHVPVFAFAAYLLAGPMPTGVALSLSLVSVGLGFASLRFIERPFRVPARQWTRNGVALLAASGMLVIALASLFIIAGHGLPARMTSAEATLVAAANDKYRHHAECMTVDTKKVVPDHACHLGTPGVAPTVLLWGDSHSMVTATALEQAALRRHAAFLFAADADCPPGLGFEIDGSVTPTLTRQLSYRYCGEYNRAMLRLALNSTNLRTIVLSARWSNWRIGEAGNPVDGNVDIRLRDREGLSRSDLANRRKWEGGFVRLVNKLTGAGKRVIIVGPLPEPSVDVPHDLYVERFGLARPTGPIAVSEYLKRHHTILQFFRQLKNRPGVSFIWPESALCSEDKCPIVEQGRPIFFDQDHLSIYGARKTSALYDNVFSPVATAKR